MMPFLIHWFSNSLTHTDHIYTASSFQPITPRPHGKARQQSTSVAPRPPVQYLLQTTTRRTGISLIHNCRNADSPPSAHPPTPPTCGSRTHATLAHNPPLPPESAAFFAGTESRWPVWTPWVGAAMTIVWRSSLTCEEIEAVTAKGAESSFGAKLVSASVSDRTYHFVATWSGAQTRTQSRWATWPPPR